MRELPQWGKPLFMKGWFFAILVTLLGQAACAAELSIVRGEYDSGKLYVPCTFDNFLDTCFIDTGATFSSVANDEQFRSYPVTGTIRFKSASGIPREADEITINSLIVDASVANFVKVAKLSSSEGFENVIGMNVISSKPFSFKFNSVSSLDLGTLMPINSQTGIELYDKGIFSIPVSMGDSKTRGLWDTGAGLTCVDINYVESNPDEFYFIKDISNGSDATGNPVVMKLYKAKKINIGKYVFENENVLAINFDVIKEHIAKDISIIVGFNLITKADWYFDLQNKMWLAEYK